MSEILQELDRLLSDPDFYGKLLMFQVVEIATRLDARDWEDIQRLWRDRGARWRGDFQWVVFRAEHPAVVPFVFGLLTSEDQDWVSEGYHLFMNMVHQTACLGDGEWETLAVLCCEHLDWQEPLEIAAWRAGKLIQFRNLLRTKSGGAA